MAADDDEDDLLSPLNTPLVDLPHPDSPSGGGGPGYFRDVQPYRGASIPSFGAWPNISAPGPAVAPAILTGLFFGPAAKPKLKRKRNRPPRTIPGHTPIDGALFFGAVVNLVVVTLDDAVGPMEDPEHAGETGCRWHPGFPVFQNPEYEYTKQNNVEVVTAQSSPPKATGILTVQTLYKRKGNEYRRAGYGRGTTTADKKNGDVTVGFHESRHRQDVFDYLKSQSLPQFDGLVGMTRGEYEMKLAQFWDEFTKLPSAIKNYTSRITDELAGAIDGIPKSKFRSGKRKKKAR